ncbi:MAG: major capsid protein [Rhodobacteraceae bacterium]|nr:major capsid protein [Paracoccaceae bacterium]
MAHMDIFTNSAFNTRELSVAVNIVPNQWGDIGQLGLFTPRPLRQTAFSVEMKNGVITLITSSQRGTPLPGNRRAKRSLKSFNTSRFGLSSQITADDIDGIRAFGQESELKQVLGEVADRQEETRGSIDITREFLRAGALQGVVRDADGTVLLDLFSEFGVTQREVDFTLGSATGFDAGCAAVTRHIKTELKGDVMRGVGALVTPTAWDKLMSNAEFKEAYKFFENTNGQNPLREDIGWGRMFAHKGIAWMEYLASGDVPQEDGSVVSTDFIPDGDMRFFPLGTRNTFFDHNAPADYMSTVGQPGTPFYSTVIPDPSKEPRFVDVEVQMNTMEMCIRPAVLVRGHSST